MNSNVFYRLLLAVSPVIAALVAGLMIVSLEVASSLQVLTAGLVLATTAVTVRWLRHQNYSRVLHLAAHVESDDFDSNPDEPSYPAGSPMIVEELETPPQEVSETERHTTPQIETESRSPVHLLWNPLDLMDAWLQAIQNPKLRVCFDDDAFAAGDMPIAVEWHDVPDLEEPYRRISEGQAEHLTHVILVREYTLETYIGLSRELLPLSPYSEIISAGIAGSVVGNAILLNVIRAMLRTRAAKRRFTRPQLTEARELIRKSVSEDVKAAAAVLTRYLNRPRRQLSSVNARNAERQHIRLWMDGRVVDLI